ncbi:MAG: DUF2249 domain-containing protein [Deltaproteobacteria bacterium]|nr:DUF2249 domain-containing protein [Deltaproteobacteria bacterium]
MRFCNDHDPLPLLEQLRTRYGASVEISYVSAGGRGSRFWCPRWNGNPGGPPRSIEVASPSARRLRLYSRHVHQDPHRQPGRDRRAHRPHLSPPRRRHRRHPLRG